MDLRQLTLKVFKVAAQHFFQFYIRIVHTDVDAILPQIPNEGDYSTLSEIISPLLEAQPQDGDLTSAEFVNLDPGGFNLETIARHDRLKDWHLNPKPA